MTTDCKTCVGGYIDELTTCENGTIIKRSALDGNVVSFKKCKNLPIRTTSHVLNAAIKCFEDKLTIGKESVISINKPEKPKVVPMLDLTNYDTIKELEGKRFFACSIDDEGKARFHYNQMSNMEMVTYASELIHQIHAGEI